MVLFQRSLTWIILLSWLKELAGDSFLIQNVRLQKCIHSSPHHAEKVSLSDCKAHSPQHQWSWDWAAWALVNQETGECLAVSRAEELAVAQLETCGEGALQAWSCSKKGRLTLQGHSLHLSMKPGGHHAFLSQERDRFSKWKTGTGTIVCATELARAPGAGEPREATLDSLEGGSKNKTGGPLEIHTPSDRATTFLMLHLESQPSVASGLPTSSDSRLEADSGLSWRTALLVLSPLAIVLGGIILMLSIQSNKKKRRLLALKSRQVSNEEHQPSPGMVNLSSKVQIIPASPSPSLKHGEILIEWKDGTITSLFDRSR